MRVAAIQLKSTPDIERNLRVAKRLMSSAAEGGAQFIALPEYFAYIGDDNRLLETVSNDSFRPAFDMLETFALEHQVYVLGGSIPVESRTGRGKLMNRAVLFAPDGGLAGSYSKVHLFNPSIPELRKYKESKIFQAGSELGLISTDFGKIGVCICYDLRFPEIFRKLTIQGARMVFVPSAFTATTGKDHWLPLLRARAIENQIYLIAPAQVGEHMIGKRSFGSSCIIDPWGRVLTIAKKGETVIFADLDFEYQKQVRRRLPVLRDTRFDLFPI